MFPAKSSLFSSHEQLYVPSSSFLLCLSTPMCNCTMYTAGNPMLVRMILLPQGTRRKTAPSFKSQFHALQHPSLQGIIAHPQTWYNTPSFKYIFVKTLFLFIAGKMPVCNFGAKFWVLLMLYKVLHVIAWCFCMITIFICIINQPTGKISPIDPSNLNLIRPWSHPVRNLHFATEFRG